MKAAVLEEVGKPFVVQDVPRPEVGPDEVLVRTCACGLCRTDVHIQDGLAYLPALPHIPGHEAAGTVAEIGSEVTGIRVGRRVVPHCFASCGVCAYCQTGQHAQCSEVRGILGSTSAGGLAEYFKVPASTLLTVPDGVPLEAAGLASCAAVTAVHAYRRSNLQVNDTAVVLGAGGIGLILVQLLTAAGVRVVAVARSAESLRLAQREGAALTLPAGAPDAAAQIHEFAGSARDGVRCVFELVGVAQTMKAAAEYVMRGGRIIVIGEEPESPPVDTIQIAQRELEIVGSRNGGLQDMADALDMMAVGVIRPVIDKRFALDDFNQAIDHLRSGQAHGRVLITVSDEVGGAA